MADVLGNRRVDEDLDFVIVGSPSRCQAKMYFNTKVDTEDSLRDKALLAQKFMLMLIKGVEGSGLAGIEELGKSVLTVKGKKVGGSGSN